MSVVCSLTCYLIHLLSDGNGKGSSYSNGGSKTQFLFFLGRQLIEPEGPLWTILNILILKRRKQTQRSYDLPKVTKLKAAES